LVAVKADSLVVATVFWKVDLSAASKAVMSAAPMALKDCSWVANLAVYSVERLVALKANGKVER